METWSGALFGRSDSKTIDDSWSCSDVNISSGCLLEFIIIWVEHSWLLSKNDSLKSDSKGSNYKTEVEVLY
jgi:hypothetical protein